jgi:2-dehydropantoate 2-reductase
MLARAGAPVVLIGRAGLADAVRENGLFLDTLAFQERVNVESSTEMSAAQSAELVLFCVKTLDTETAAQQLARLPVLRCCRRQSTWRRLWLDPGG